MTPTHTHTGNFKLWKSLHYSWHLNAFAAPQAAISMWSFSCSSEGEFKVPYYRKRDGARGPPSSQLKWEGTTFRLWQLLMTGVELQIKMRGWHVFMMSIHRFQEVLGCATETHYVRCIMGLQSPGWQEKVIGWCDSESRCNWLTSEVQLKAARL